MKPWLVEMLIITAGATLALATVAGTIALVEPRPLDGRCGAATMALTLAFDPAVSPGAVLAGLEATSRPCPESLQTAR